MFKEELTPNYKYNTELYHHGILGMKWGKRNGPPYPLDPSDHSAAEKKAASKKSISKRFAKFASGDNKYEKKYDKISAKREAAYEKLGDGPKQWYKDNDYRKGMTREAKKYDLKSRNIENKYYPKMSKLSYKAWNYQRKEEKRIFTSKELKEDAKKVYQKGKEIDELRDKYLRYGSEPYENAYKKYIEKLRKENPDETIDPDDDETLYGFDHYQWRSGNPDYEKARKAMAKDPVFKEYDDACKNLTNKLMKDLNDLPKDKYNDIKDFGEMCVNQLDFKSDWFD